MLKKNYEFQKVFKKGTWYGSDLLNIYVCKNNYDTNYIGVAVGKKISKSSVKRNRIRRIIKEVYRINEKKLKSGYSIIIAWKNDCPFELANFSDIEKSLINCFKKADIIEEYEEDTNV